MAAGMLPPVLFVLRANATQFMGSMTAARGELAKTAAAGDSMAARAKTAANKYSSVIAKGTLIASAAVAVESVKMAADFQKQMTLLQTAGGETASNMKTVSNGIKQIAMQTGTSTAQLADGMYIVEKAGIRGADGLKILKAASEGAKAENVDLGTATNALTSVMMSYHLKAADAVSVQNQLVAGSGMAKTTMENYAGSLSTVIPIASAAGVSFDQVAGAIATLTQHGTSAQESTQELASTIRNLQAPNNVAVAAMAQMGISSTDLSKNLGKRGLTGTLDIITNTLAKNTQGGLLYMDTMKRMASGTADLQTMLGKMPAALKKSSQEFLSGKMSMTDYRKEFKSLGASGSAMGAQFMALASKVSGYNDNLKAGTPAQQTMVAQLKKIMGGSIGLNTALMLGGENMSYFKKATADVGAAGAKSGKDISTWALTQKTLSVQLDKAKEMVQVLAINIGTKLIPIVTSIIQWLVKHKDTVLTVIKGLAILGAAMIAVRIALIAWKVATTAWMVVTKLATAAMWLFNAAMNANPITIVVAAIVALGVGVYEAYQHFEPFRHAVQNVGNAFVWFYQNAIMPVANFFKNNWKTILTAAGVVFLPFIALPLLVVKNWGAITGFFTKLWGSIEKIFKTVVSTVVGVIKGWYPVILGVLSGGLLLVPALIFKYWSKITSFVSQAFNATIGYLKTVPGKILGIFAGAGTWLYNIGRSLFGGLWNGIKSVFSTIGSLGKDLYNMVAGSINRDLIDPMKNWHFTIGAFGVHHTFQPFGGLPEIPMLAKGGIVTKPTLAMIGEAGPEAVIPLHAGAARRPAAQSDDGGGTHIHVTVQGSIIDQQGFMRAMQQAALQHGGVNSQTWAPFKRS